TSALPGSGGETLRVQAGALTLTGDAVVRQIQKMVMAGERPAYVARDTRGDALWSILQRFYRRRNFAPAWVADDEVRIPQAADFDVRLTYAYLYYRAAANPQDANRMRALGALARTGEQPHERICHESRASRRR